VAAAIQNAAPRPILPGELIVRDNIAPMLVISVGWVDFYT
jgi:hypothetical protein